MKYLFSMKSRWPQMAALGLMLGVLSTSVSAQQAGCTYPSGQTPTPYNGTWTPPLGAAGYNPGVNYCVPNFSVSPPLKKFVDAMPGVGSSNKNGLGQYIPLAQPDTSTFPGNDYYEIGLKQYTERMHSDLPSGMATTKLRGFYQKNGSDSTNHYLGPMIMAKRGKAVRLKFFNELLLSNQPNGYLPLPMDRNLMGAGMGPLAADGVTPCDPMVTNTCANYSDNRAVIHLHGGLTPWISDGTPHQWITPAGEPAVYKKGDSFQNVPDMIGTGRGQFTPAPKDGIGTYYYTNNQSGRLLFYHDHSLGLTRLNVYAGMAAPYLIVDPVEDLLMTGGTSGSFTIPAGVLPDQSNLLGVGTTGSVAEYKYGIPLVIQDKSFVNGDMYGTGANGPLVNGLPTNGATAGMPATKDSDPLWFKHVNNSQHGDLWLPHEYLPNEDPFNTWYDPATNSYGANPKGRWDYAPWMNPPAVPMNDVLPSPTAIPETYGDTMLVNGTAFPYMELPSTAARFRVLNASNDRFLNLQLYYASTKDGVLCRGNAVTDLSLCTEVSMIPAIDYKAYAGLKVDVGNMKIDTASMPASWPTDGRAGGVPYWAHSGPDILQIGNEAGFLAQVAPWPSQPVDFDHNTRSVTLNGITSRSLMLPSAVRADVVVDFSSVPAGSALIMYNDAPAPMPLWDNRNDYYTNDGDQTDGGGAPNTEPGYGPNTRTVMQFRITGAPSSPSAFTLAKLTSELPKAFLLAQKPPHVPQTFYPDATGVVPNTAVTNVYANVMDESLNISGTKQTVNRVVVTAPGQSYNKAPTVKLSGGACVDTLNKPAFPTATASLDGLTGVNLVTGGTGYTTIPTVTITPAVGGGGAGATAVATVTGGIVTGVYVTNPGSGYLLAPTVTITGGGGTGATATSNVITGSVGSITLGANAGTIKCLSSPLVTLVAGKGNPGTGATAVTTLTGDLVLDGKNLIEGFDREYGRMDAMLGSTPNPLTPVMGAGPVVGVAYYVDPPTEVLTGNTTYLWRIMHIGVDSHAIHFHLFDVQLINRVDWTGVIKPPFADEFGWKETVRTNPFEDIIVALKPSATDMALPFTIPNSLRLLDPTVPAGSTGIFSPVAPPPGVAAVAQTTNVVNSFGWEYVWHCHLLGHEENDMMRPIVFYPEMPTGGLNPQSLTFAAAAVGSTSAAQTVTLTNSGVMPLAISAISFTSDTGATGAQLDFQRLGGTCVVPSSLVSGASCTITVVFKPSTSGAITGALIVTDNSMGRAGAQQSVILKGAGQAPMATLSTTALDFGTVSTAATSPAQVITLTNSGSGPLGSIAVTSSAADYTVVPGAGTCPAAPNTLAPGASCNVYVTFKPLANGTRTANLTIATSAGPSVVSMTGLGVTLPMATFSVAAMNFGTSKVGVNPATQLVTVTNTGDPGSTLNVAVPTTTLPFSVTGGVCNLAKNASCTFTVGFAATAAGTYTQNLQLSTNSGGVAATLQQVALSAVAAVPQAQLTAASATFAPATVSSTNTLTANLSNTGVVPLAFTSIAMNYVSGTSSVLTQTNSCVSPLAAGASCVITVTYKPTAGSSTDVANLVVTDDSGGVLNTTQTIQFTGTSTYLPTASVSVSALDFGTGYTGLTSSAQVVTLTNTGAGPLGNIVVTSNTADYTVVPGSSTCPAAPNSLGIGLSCSFSVTFKPLTVGTKTGSLSIASMAGTNTVSLTGVGVAPPTASFSAVSLNFGTNKVGVNPATQLVTVTNTGGSGSTLNVALPTATAPFSVTGSACTLSQNASCSFTVGFAATAAGTNTQNLQITTNSGGNPGVVQQVALSAVAAVPQAQLTTALATFAPATVSSTSTTTATLTNTGTVPLAFTSIAMSDVSGTPGVLKQTNSCVSPLAAGASCVITVTYKPTVGTSTDKANLVVTDDSGGVVNATQTLQFTGTSTYLPMVSVSVNALDFASVYTSVTSSAQLVTLTNTGAGPLGNIVATSNAADYTVVAGTCPVAPNTLAAGLSCNLSVTFKPTATGTRAGSVTITSMAGTNTVSLTGVGVAPPVATFSSAALNFGTNKVGVNPATQLVTVTNTGGAGSTLNVAVPAATAPFSVTGSACALLQNASCTFTVAYAATAAGTFTQNVAFTSNSGGTAGAVQQVALSAVAAVPQAALTTASATFVNAAIGSTSATTATLTNTGVVPLAFSSIAVIDVSGTPGVLTQANSCVSPLAAGASCVITVTYKPTVGSSTDKATLTVTDDMGGVANTAQTVAYTGTSAAPLPVAALTGTLNFGAGVVASGATSTLAATLTNSGTAKLTIASIATAPAAGAFTVVAGSTTCSAVNGLAVGQSCTVTVQFAPKAAKTAYSGTLTITDNHNGVANSKQTLTISGTSK
ncbi:choice-of-anchor D domain-containing protein [Limnohabitans sp. Jir72]|uniref:choice-of-anchor D domain-containing protein n=1 Tax=Limnohabitans sp. Jir72 TaxID=1977909 RepID=UPI0011B1F673|nr:choice-of-anchor D domain-containing protein [Limnohabitans sp. Jir72]